MTTQVRLSHFITLNTTPYAPGDVAALTDDLATEVISAGMGTLVSGQVVTAPRIPLRTDTLNMLTGEQENMPWWASKDATITMTSGLARFGFFTARRSFTVTSLRLVSGGTAAAATPSLVKFGLYSVSYAAGVETTLTRIGLTASDTSTFAATATAYTKALATAVGIAEGTRYAIGALVVTAAAAPTVQGLVGGPVQALPIYAAQIAAQADLGASYAVSALTNSASVPYTVAVP
jgi:hypothetical protein